MKYYPFGVDDQGTIQYLSPNILQELYGLDKVESKEISDIAIKIFKLETDGSLPLDWKELYKNIA